MQQVNAQRKTLTERVIHAISFEGLATLILAPTAAWLMQRSVVEMATRLSLTSAAIRKSTACRRSMADCALRKRWRSAR